jgi:hypothetical protein
MENDDESAAVSLFRQLYRESPQLRRWLQGDYAGDATLRARFDSLAMDESAARVTRFTELAEENHAWRKERSRLKAQVAGTPYGGLTWNQITELICQYQAGTLDAGVFLFVRDWRCAGKPTPALRWAGSALLESVLPSGRRRLLNHLDAALGLAVKYENKKQRRSAVGYADWWKLNTLFYILRHPSESYRTRELIAHLTTLELNIGTKDMRRFCARHGIRRDMRAGRPRKRTAATRRTHCLDTGEITEAGGLLRLV